MNDELLALATEIMDWHDCADGDVDAGNGHFRLVCLNDSEQQRLNLRAVLREAASTLRLAAQSPEPVAWQYRVMFDKGSARENEWCPWRDAGKKYFDKVTAEIAAGATRVQTRILYTAPPQPASDGALREALDIAVDIIMASEPGHSCAVSDIAVALAAVACGDISEPVMKVMRDWRQALAASEATKSDGGAEGRAASGQSCIYAGNGPNGEFQCIYCGEPGPSLGTIYGDYTPITVGASSVPSDTRPADVTVEVRALIAFVQSVFDFYNEGHAMPMWIGRDARALLDAYKIGAK